MAPVFSSCRSSVEINREEQFGFLIVIHFNAWRCASFYIWLQGFADPSRNSLCPPPPFQLQSVQGGPAQVLEHGASEFVPEAISSGRNSALRRRGQSS